MFMRNVGVLSRLAYCMTWGRTHNYFYVFIFSCGKSLYSRHFWMCFLSSHAVSVNGARHNNEQLTDIRNKSAESLKTN